MIAEKEFESFGVKYRTKQFSAARGVELLFRSDEVYPTEYLEKQKFCLNFRERKRMDKSERFCEHRQGRS